MRKGNAQNVGWIKIKSTTVSKIKKEQQLQKIPRVFNLKIINSYVIETADSKSEFVYLKSSF